MPISIYKTTSIIIGILSLFQSQHHVQSLSTPVAAAIDTTSLVLKDYSGTAAGLFNNMRTPAALIGGAIVPLGLLTAPEIDKSKDSKRVQLFKKVNLLLAIASLLSEILAITFSTVAINKLAEVKFPPTTGGMNFYRSILRLHGWEQMFTFCWECSGLDCWLDPKHSSRMDLRLGKYLVAGVGCCSFPSLFIDSQSGNCPWGRR
eukprot:23117_1